MRLSVLDQSPIPEGSTAAQALHNTVDLGRHAEALGYERYWLAEHHATPALACASPEVLIAAVAQATERIRVGSGGVMLPHYSPLKVAEVFSTLAGLHPERIDLGLGRAPGTDPMTMLALQRDRRQGSPDDFPEQLTELLALLEDRVPPNHPFARHARTLPGCRSARSRGCSARRLRARSGRASWGCPTRSRTSSTRAAPRSPPTTARASSTPSASRRRA